MQHNNRNNLRVCAFVLCACATALAVAWSNASSGVPIGAAIAQPMPRARPADPVLTFERSVECPASPAGAETADPPTTSALPNAEQFVAGEHFREAIGASAEVQITWLGAAFREHFLAKTEPPAGPTQLRIHGLHAASRDEAIIAELGDTHETMLGHLWCLLRQQANGQAGPLLSNGVPNIFYIRDGAGTLRAVDVLWGGTGWEIGASSIDDALPWSPGRHVISR